MISRESEEDLRCPSKKLKLEWTIGLDNYKGMMTEYIFEMYGVKYYLTFMITRPSNNVSYECLSRRPFL